MGGSEEDEREHAPRRVRPVDKSDESFSGIELRARGRLSWPSLWKVLTNERFQLMAVLIGLLGPQAAASYHIKQTTEATQQATIEAKEVAEVKNEVTKQVATEAKETAENIEHELKNGLADRIAAKVGAKIDAKIDAKLNPINQRLNAIQKFLTGDEAALPAPDIMDLAKPE